jgi:hypothetical protein
VHPDQNAGRLLSKTKKTVLHEWVDALARRKIN